MNPEPLMLADDYMIDTDGDGVPETAYSYDVDTGVQLFTNVDDIGNTVTVAYDAFGVLMGADVTTVTGEHVQITGDGVQSFLTDLAELNGDDAFDPLGHGDMCCQVPVFEETTLSIDEMETYVEQYPAEVAEVLSPAQVPVDTAQPEELASSVIGDPTDAEFWFQQNTAYTCGPASATQIVSDFTGNVFADESELAAYAAEKGWLTENGMVPEHIAQLLTDFQVPSEVLTDQGWGDIAQYLSDGRSVVMFVDGFDYWPDSDAQDQPEDSDEDVVNHFIRIVGIDTERGVAILADPGHPDGYKMEVPLTLLEEAWDDVTAYDAEGDALREHTLIVSTGSDPSPDGELAGAQAFEDTPPKEGGLVDLSAQDSDVGLPGGGSGLFSNDNGWVLLPVTLGPIAILVSRLVYSATRKN